MKRSKSYLTTMYLFIFLFSFILFQFIGEHFYQWEPLFSVNFYSKKWFILLVVCLLLSYSFVLIQLIQKVIIKFSWRLFGSILLHASFLLFILFGLLHLHHFFFKEINIVVEKDKLYEIEKNSYLRSTSEEIQLIELIEGKYHIKERVKQEANHLNDKHIKLIKLTERKRIDRYTAFINGEEVQVQWNGNKHYLSSNNHFKVKYVPENSMINNYYLFIEEIESKKNWLVTEEGIYPKENVQLEQMEMKWEDEFLITHSNLFPLFIFASVIYVTGFIINILSRWGKKDESITY